VIILEPEGINELISFTQNLRKLSLGTPIFAVCDETKTDIDRIPKWCFDRIFSDNDYSSNVYYAINEILESKGLPKIGFYRLAGIDASVELDGVYYFDEKIKLTKTETTILRYIMRSFPVPCPARDILTHAYKSKDKPELSNIRTHISMINKKFRAQFDKTIIISTEDKRGYKIAIPELIIK
jgi:hypothetical protein